MLRHLTLLLALIIFSSLFQTTSFAYTEEETSSIQQLEDNDSPFLPKLPLADLVKPIDVLNAPSTLDDVASPENGEILIEQEQNTLNSGLSPPSTI